MVPQKDAKVPYHGMDLLLSKVRQPIFLYVCLTETNLNRAMAKYLSGPPGGRTLPQTPTRLSDLAGGVYGPGASVASTGLNVQRASIKAGIARAAGETWEDVLEYYLVCLTALFHRQGGLIAFWIVQC